MTDRSVGPRCGNNPNFKMSDGDRKAVDDFKARLALKEAAKPYIERAVWVDFDPLMEVIAATLWEHCARDGEEMPQLVCDDPRTIAAFAAAVARAHAAAVPAPATDQAALRDRIRRAVCEANGFDFDSDMLEPDEYGDHADMILAVLPAVADLAELTKQIDLRDYWHAEAMSATTRIIELEGQLEESRRAAVAPADLAEQRADAPVRQRADCTELEWAEQERARFERLYTRETVRADLAEQRADTAARDADIYQKRLERLGEGYTAQCKRAEEAEQRAEAMERAMESTAADALAHRGCHRELMAQCLRAERAEAEAERLRADRAATCICGHTEAQHFEDACLVCDCGDYLVPEAAREVIARWRTAALHARADRAAVLTAGERTMLTFALDQAQEKIWSEDGFTDEDQAAVTSLRRMADETQQPEAEAHPPEHSWAPELYDPLAEEWVPGTRYITRDRAVNHLTHANSVGSTWKDGTPVQRRLVRATTTYTVEAEPAAVQQPKEARP